MSDQNTDILVNVDLEPPPNPNSNVNTIKLAHQNSTSSNNDASNGGPINSVDAIEADAPLRSYQNQTAEDIESGRSRIDSVTSVASYGSGGSEDALLPEVSVRPSTSGGIAKLTTSPRRSNRENLPLLRGRNHAHGHQRMSSYEDIDEDAVNVFPGNKELASPALFFRLVLTSVLLLFLDLIVSSESKSKRESL